MRFLRQSTSVDVPIGPFLSDSDGKTPASALTITQPDIRLKKNGGAWAQKNAAQTLTHEEGGYYEVTLDATDSDTAGALRLSVEESGALPVWEDFMVLPANAYDALVLGTDLLQIDVSQFGNAAGTFSGGRPEVITSTIGVGALAALAAAVWDALTSVITATGSIGKFIQDRLDVVLSTRASPAQVNTEADTALTDAGVTSAVMARLDATVSSRLAGASYTAPPSAAANASATRTELATELGRLDAAVSSRSSHTASDVWTQTVRTVTNGAGVKKNTAFTAFDFFMVQASDSKTPATGLTITATRRIDGGSFAACTNAATEVGGGWYTIDLAASDLNGDRITLSFAGTGADTRRIIIVTEP